MVSGFETSAAEGTISSMSDEPTDSASRDPATKDAARRSTTVANVVGGLLERLHIEPMKRRHGARGVQAIFTFVFGTLSIGLLALIANLADSPFIFPSLGPTAYLLFHRPLARASSPRNVVSGHFIGAVCGWLSLAVFGLLGAPDVLTAGTTWAHVGSAALSLGLTGGLMAYFRVGHPPAGATTLIVSLGLMPHLWQLPVLMVAVAMLTLQGLVINRLAGLDYPWWEPRRNGSSASSSDETAPDQDSN